MDNTDTQSELVHQLDSMRELFDKSPTMSLLVDEQFNLLLYNKAAIKFIGLDTISAEDARSLNFASVFAAMIPEVQLETGNVSYTIQERMAEVKRFGRVDFPTEMVNGKGERRNLEMTIQNIPYMQGNALLIYAVDVTPLKSAERALKHRGSLLQAVNSVAENVLMKESSLDELAYSSLEILSRALKVDRSFAWQNVTVEGKLYSKQFASWKADAAPPELAPLMPFEQVLDKIVKWKPEGTGIEVINAFVRDLPPGAISKEATEGMLSFLVTSITYKGKFWGFITFEDFTTERTFTEDEVQILTSGGMLLASAMTQQELMRDLVESREEALRSNTAKSEFLSRMSHEIRTPLNAIIGMAAIAGRSDEPERISASLQKIDDSSRQLLSIINDVLDMSKIESGKFEISVSAFNFERMLEHVINVTQVKMEEKNLTFTISVPGSFPRQCVSDELRFSQVLINLLNNAAKFTPENGKIELRVICDDIDAPQSTIRVELSDTGIGITKEQQQKLFNSFEQADGTISRQYGGTGLGLAICKNIVNLMGGEIWVESVYGEGSTFIFEIPVSWGDPIIRTGSLTLKRDIKILIVDDNADIVDYFAGLLKGFRLSSDKAVGGLAAVAAIQKAVDIGRPYDLIMLDWIMPDLNGEECAKFIREVSGAASEIIIISTLDKSDLDSKMKKYGISHYLPKPVLPSILFDTLVGMFGSLKNEQSKTVPCDWSGKKLLLVEDIEINREIIITLLEDTCIKIDCAENGLEAVALIEKSPDYDLVLMDVQMPVLDGLAATRRIRELNTQYFRSVPIIAMTANAFKEDIKRCKDAGMNDHLSKPVEIDAMYSLLTNYLEQDFMLEKDFKNKQELS